MDILRKYAEEQGYDYQQLLSDYYSSPKQEQDMFMAQLGGQQPQPEQPQGGGDQVMQIIQMFAQLTGEDPQAIMDQLQQLPPEQQQAAIEEMVAAIQQTQQQAQYGGKFGLKKKSIPVTSNGYYEYNPENTPQLIVPSGNITMAGIDYPIKATDADTGEYLGIMQPEQEYRFKAKNVLEEPVYAQRARTESTRVETRLIGKKFLKHDFETLKKVIQDESGIDLSRVKDKKALVEFVETFSNNGQKTLGRYLPAVQSLEGTKTTTTKKVTIPDSNTFLDEFRLVKAGNKEKESRMFDNKPKTFIDDLPDLGDGISNISSVLSQQFKGIELTDKSKDIVKEAKKYLKQNSGPIVNLNVNTKEGKENLQEIKNWASGVMQQVVKPGSKFPKATEGTYEAPAEPSKNITVQGSNKNYNLTWDRDNKADGSSLYNDSEGNRWMKSKDGSVKIIHKGNSSSSVGSPRNSLAPVTQRQRVGSKYLPVKSDKNSWVGDWEKFLVGQGILDGDKTYSVNDIDDTVAEYVKNNPEFYKDNKYIGQKDFGSLLKDGIYGKVHESVRPPSGLSTTSDRWKLPEDIEKSGSITTRPTRFDKDPITGRIPATGGVAPKAIKSPDESVVKPKGQQFKFNTRNMLQGLVAQQNVTQAYQPIALPFRRHIDLEAPQAKMIDENVVLAPIMQAFEKTVANINPNSTTGMAFKSNLFGKLTETIPTVLNDINIKNQEIFNANQMAMASARNQEQHFNINADKTAYNDMLASYANRDAAIGASLQGLSNLATANALDDAKLDGYLLENPYLTESTNFIERLFGNRTFEMDPEYRQIVKKTALQIASEKAEADKAKKA